MEVKRFHRKRKAPATRSNPVKIQKKDVNLAAETLLELSTTALHDANEQMDSDSLFDRTGKSHTN